MSCEDDHFLLPERFVKHFFEKFHHAHYQSIQTKTVEHNGATCFTHSLVDNERRLTMNCQNFMDNLVKTTTVCLQNASLNVFWHFSIML